MPFQLNNAEALTPAITQLGAAVDTVAVGGAAGVPANCRYEVNLMVSNTSLNARIFSLYLRPVGDVAAAANEIAANVAIAASTVYIVGPFVIPAGYVISGLADLAASVTVIATGYIVNEAVQ